MDFLDPQKMRRFTIRLFIGYVLVAIAVLLATTLLIMYAYGFRIDREGRLNQFGLVFFSSQPTGADILINNETIDTTNAKLNLAAGKYDVRLTRAGYIDWKRDVLIEGGSVDHYVYPLLIPNELVSSQIVTFAEAPLLATQSPDKRWLVVQEASGDSFRQFDLNRSIDAVDDSSVFEIPATAVSPSLTPAAWTIKEWSTNNRHILATREYTTETGAQTEYIVIDRARPENTRNLTTELHLLPTAVPSLRDKKPDSFYIYDTTSRELATATLADPEFSVVLTDVITFKAHGADMLLYATDTNADEGKVRLVLKDRAQTYDIRTVAASEVYLLDLARYDGDWYVVAGASSEGRTYVYRNPVTSIKQRRDGKPDSFFIFRQGGAKHVSFSANAQFIALQNGEEVHVYDLDNITTYRYALQMPLDAPQTYASWMDGHRLGYISGGKQVFVEYDNTNPRTLSSALPALGGFYDRNTRYLYSFTQLDPNNPAITLQATALRTAVDL